MRDPYAVLGVKRDADASEIKSAWRALAKKIHPDQNRNDPNAAKSFAEAGAAYELLRDPQKRSRYDLLSQSGKQEATIQQQREAAREAAAKRKAAEENARRVMEELMKAEAEKARKAQAEAARQQAQGQKADASASERPQGEASGAQPGNQPPGGGAAGASQPQADAAASGKSAGTESAEDVINRIFGSQPNFSDASAAREGDGETRSGSPSGSAESGATSPIKLIGDFIRRLTGRVPPEKAPDQFVEARITIEDLLKENFVTVPTQEGRDLRFRLEAGQTDGDTVRLKGQGFRVPGMQRGDAVVTLRVEPTALFSVSGHDIRTSLPIPLENAVLGCSAEVQSPTGPIEVTVPAWTGSDQSIRIPGQGLFDGKGGRGDLVVDIRIILWEKPDAKVTDLMRAMKDGLYL